MSSGWNVGDDEQGQFRQFWQDLNNFGEEWNFDDALQAAGDDWNIWDDQRQAQADEDATTFPSASSSSTWNPTWDTSSPITPARNQRVRSRPRTPDHSRFPPSSPRHMGNAPSSSNTSASRNPTSPGVYRPANITSHNQHRPTNGRRSSPDYRSDTFDFDSFLAPTTPDSDTFDGIDIDDLLNSDIESDTMPTTTRRRQYQNESVVDLTNDASSPPQNNSTNGRAPRSLKRTAAESASEARASKRPRHSSAPTDSRQNHREPTQIEELDLTAENPSLEEELLANQRAAAIAAQQPHPTGPLRIGKRTCIICLEPFTDATITHCGHIYCHECLTQALKAGEKNSERGVGNCPVCRKPVSRKKGNQVIAVSFMKGSAFRNKGRREVGMLA